MEAVSVIEFVRTSGHYRAGERAGFPPALAEKYVRRGSAKMVKADAPALDANIDAPEARKAPASSRAV